MEGQILGNRYELVEKIGGGGMALVYKAKCQLLNRFVAVKILRPEFTNDEEFVKRFKIEAQSAASLSHPNIVSIYDVGYEGNLHYIVMEYIDGITLKEYITERGVLKWKEAVDITIQIASAIEHAHRNHIVHRDIKPHNIIITKEHIAKVTDFGIARAVSSSTITMVGSTIGSVHYFSPEQARGGYTDEKSDLYSIGIVLYEMVTGRVPFDGETPVAIALKHIQVEPQAPIEINPGIPQGINDIILKAIKKEQNKRYQIAADMLNDLFRVMKEPDTQIMFAEDDVKEPTKRVKTITDKEIKGDDSFFVKQDKKPEDKKKDRFTYIIAGALALILVVSLTFISYKIASKTDPKEKPKSEFVVGNYVKDNIKDVKTRLAKSKIYVTEKREHNKDIPKDTIISQGTDPKKTLKKGSHIELVVSDGPEIVKLPDLRNKDWRDAESQIKDMKLVPDTIGENNDTITYGWVIRTEPGADEEVQIGDTIKVYKSLGPLLEKVKVPSVKGMTQQQAMNAIRNAGLKLGKIYPEDQNNYEAKVVKTEPAAGIEVPEESPVDIYLEQKQPAITNKSFKISLDYPENYGDVIEVVVELTPSDTGKVETLKYVKDKNEFPFSISVPVPTGGSTNVRVFYDGEQYGPDNPVY
ncbi:MAG TPA: Stk1 family PASTA domain-containing Ser/Thr kinase [Clostridia bacterium]|nr:Stk1 family PASTA domain-containing Ser/Thr kinase [Clostridia bacterium]